MFDFQSGQLFHAVLNVADSVGSNCGKRNAVHKRNIKVNVDALILKNRNLNAAFNIFSAGGADHE